MNSPRLNHVASVEIVNKSHFIVPNRRVNGFIGREDILDKIEKGLSSESQSRVVVLRGLGGQGKTQIALDRHADTAGLVGSDHHIKLPGLPKDDACDLLIRQSRGGDAASRDDAYTIVDRLGYHALAITQAGSYIQTQKIELSQFMDNYNHRREAILRVTPRMSQYRRKVGKAANETALNVFTTWEPSYQQLEKLDDENKHKSVINATYLYIL
ncbi:hypothetical protein SS1G_02492 [Sclerotinia sclerotiorum 1980 UF-70]|uniref:NB-ARC domain-containing protein n=1 Tax=Sclerotinia sclerotiorum (strain ATCC 18683 / 1980 / Ss-1) TaxID=665079 RepID=A7EB06_SCLS1|nr:hypothetical protein SS1G_02492 [Sclerotinia sclerotiorum 1980 UF-70]EDN99634.1 hypothetical protein SS1G_02492 [Sclerotinia sclerotiorum 1980 UF-70]